jgi:type III pantothenate kinase|tara:strand:+ start:203 stop:949 length:747 start_codon:yes stop_codon:yes gene_type:complete
MILVGDIGNTETKICLVNSKKKIIKRITFETKSLNQALLIRSFNKINFTNKSIKKILFCSVVPKTYKLIKNFLNRKYNLKCYELKELKINSLLKIKVNFKQVGSDRLANSLGVFNKKDNFIILDFGTATTFDVLIKNIYHGGIIAPGLKLSLNTLIDRASLIPKLDLKKTNKVIGVNTITAVRSGFFWGYRGLIDNIVQLIIKETGKSFKIISTGGFSYLFKKSMNKNIIINKDITIKGLIKASNLIK